MNEEINKQREESKLYKLLPQLEEAIIEYQDTFGVNVDAIEAVMARFSSVQPAQLVSLHIKETITVPL